MQCSVRKIIDKSFADAGPLPDYAEVSIVIDLGFTAPDRVHANRLLPQPNFLLDRIEVQLSHRWSQGAELKIHQFTP